MVLDQSKSPCDMIFSTFDNCDSYMKLLQLTLLHSQCFAVFMADLIRLMNPFIIAEVAMTED